MKEFFSKEENVEFLGKVIGNENKALYKITMPENISTKEEAIKYLEEWYANRVEYSIDTAVIGTDYINDNNAGVTIVVERYVAYITIIPTFLKLSPHF